MIEIALIIAFIGSLTAGVLDLKTTEFPDDIPYLMIALGIFIWYIYAMTFGDFLPLFLSLTIGLIFGAIGWIAYKTGAWGDGDSAILTAIVFLVPSLAFLISYLMNMLIVAVIYLVIYSLVLGIKHKILFLEELKSNFRYIVTYLIMLPFAIIASYTFNFWMFSIIWALGFAMILFILYAKKIEKNVFKKRIPASQIKAGDVLASSRQWVGITEEEAEKIHKNLKFVEIKEGVRFTIVFPLAIIVTLLFGNILFLILA